MSQGSETIKTNAPKGYRLVWSDEFENDGLPDPTKWVFDIHRNKDGWYNDEDQYYADKRLKNARVEGGRLIIEAHAEDLSKQGFADWGGQKYTSARLLTQGLADWTYGFFEIRAKLPCGVGTWPAVWMVFADPMAQWPEGGEIDIMEHVGVDPGNIHHSVHTGAYNHVTKTQKTGQKMVPDACDAFHKYQVLWTTDRMQFSIDDEPTFEFQREEGYMKWPFYNPYFLILNIAVGGMWGALEGIDDAAFPAQMKVDYVRVYQKG